MVLFVHVQSMVAQFRPRPSLNSEAFWGSHRRRVCMSAVIFPAF
jgi:hypothetical protein